MKVLPALYPAEFSAVFFLSVLCSLMVTYGFGIDRAAITKLH